jgi:tyrosine-protein kinase Etk/Wzc
MPVSIRKRRGLVDTTSASSEPFRTLRLALQLRSEARTGNIVLVTSAEPKAGKSTVAANHALVSSLGQSRVLLVDGDLRAPTVHDFFGLPRSPGLVDVLAAGVGIEQFVRKVELGNLEVLTAGRPIPRASDLASSHRMGDLLAEASERYDVVVIDSPPILSAADAEGLASHPGVDVVVVVRPTTKRRALQKALRKLDLIEANVAGIVVNGQGRAAPYSYSY